MLADLEGKGRRVRTVAVPIWVKQGINAWMTAGAIEEGRMLRSISKGGKIGEGDWGRALRSPRPALDLRQVLPQERWRPGTDQVSARALFHPDD